VRRLLVVQHSPTPTVRALLDALLAGATDDAIDGVEVEVRAALEPSVDAVRSAHGVLLVTTENFGYMSGALKHFFDATYNDLLEHTQGLPYALLVKAGHDGTGAIRAVESITTGLRWRRVREPLLVVGDPTPEDLEAATELGGMLAAGTAMGAL
jgi:NAD(P)H-dependent FMN reductase